MLLIEPPPIESAMNAASADSGIEKNTATVARMLPRKIRIIMRRQQQTDGAFVQQRLDRRLDEQRLIEHHLRHQFLGHIEQVLQSLP